MNFILLVIVINSITMGMQTSKYLQETIGGILTLIDEIALTIFVIEIILKLIVYRWRFFLNGWNDFDFVIVGISLLPNMGTLSVLRTLRTLRAMRGMRIISAVPEMRRVVEGLLRAIPGMLSIISLMLLDYYICAILATTLFGEKFPEWFGTLGASFYSLFQIMTLESWSMGIVRPVMVEFPYAWLFFVPFIMVNTFSVMNLFVAVIVTAVQSSDSAPSDSEVSEEGKETSGMETRKSSDSLDSEAPTPTGSSISIESLSGQIHALHLEVAQLKALLVKQTTSPETDV